MTMSVDARVANSAVVRTKVWCALLLTRRASEIFLYAVDKLGVLARRIDCPTATINSSPSWFVTGKTRKNPRSLRGYPFDLLKGMT
jgi:hypothetical protein